MTEQTNSHNVFRLDARPARFRYSALVLLDCRDAYRHGVLEVDGVQVAVAEAARLLHRARASKIPVFHVIHDPGDGTDDGIPAENARIRSQLAPVPGEPVIVKHHPSAFRGTDLGDLLDRAHCRELVLAGLCTHAGINATARDAFDLGYQTTIVANATATRERPDTRAPVVPLRSARRSAGLSDIADRYAVVVGTGAEIPA